MSDDGLRAFLDRLGLGEFFDALHAERIAVQDLAFLTDSDLSTLGLPLGPRRRLMRAAQGNPVQPVQSEGERRNLTVLFCDMVDSTAIASRIDPEDLRAIYNAFHETCAAAIEAEDGHVAHRAGDGLMAHFGFPRAMEDAAIRAVRAGLEIVNRVSRISPSGVAIAVRVGVASGLTVIGQTGPGFDSADDTATGVTLSLASRLQSLAPPGGVVVSDMTRRLLGDAFDLEPLGSKVLKGFAEHVMVWQARSPTRRGPRQAAEAHPAGRLIGRERELADLRSCWTGSLGGQGGSVMVRGEPGIGKSRLVAELCREAADSGTVITLHCSRYSNGAAHHPVVEWLLQEAGADNGTGPEAAIARVPGVSPATAPLFAGLARGFPTSDMADEDALRRQDDIIEAVVSLLAPKRSAQARLLVVEDVQWADAATLEVLDRLAERARDLPFLVVATARPDAEQRPDRHGTRVMDLAPLSTASALELVAIQTGAGDLPEAVRRMIAERCGGVPLFAAELTRSVLEAPDADAADVPMTLQDTLMARLDRLQAGKRVAQVGALIGTSFSMGLLAACTGLADAVLRQGIAELVAANLIEIKGEAAHTFRHALVRDIAYGSLLRSQRVALHRRVARTIERDFPELAEMMPEQLAHHHAQAGEIEAAVPYWQQAAERNMSRGAPSSAVTCLSSAIDLLLRLPVSPQRDARELAVRQRLNLPLTVLHGFASPATEANLARMTTLLDAGEPGEDTLQLLWSRCMSALVRSDLSSVRVYARQLQLDVTRSALPNAARLPERMLGYVALLEGELDAAETHFDRVLDGYAPVAFDAILPGHPFDVVASTLAQRAILSALRGRGGAVDADQTRALGRARDLSSPATSFQVLVHLCLARFELEDHEGVVPLLSELRELVDNNEISPLYTDAWEAWFRARSGALDDGLADMKRAQEAGTQYPLWMPRLLLLQAHLLMENHRYEDAIRTIDDCDARIGLFRHGYLLSEAKRRRAACLSALGTDPRVVEALINEAVAIAGAQGAWRFEAAALRDLDAFRRQHRAEKDTTA